MKSGSREFDSIESTRWFEMRRWGTLMMGEYLLVISLTSSWCLLFLPPVVLPLPYVGWPISRSFLPHQRGEAIMAQPAEFASTQLLSISYPQSVLDHYSFIKCFLTHGSEMIQLSLWNQEIIPLEQRERQTKQEITINQNRICEKKIYIVYCSH